MKSFRFSVSLHGATSPDDIRAFARKAEDLGFDLLAMPDHLVPMLPPFLALLSAAEATKTIRVGTLVLNNDLRHPAMVARESAALDLLTGGRFELGIGAGHAKPEYESIGLPFDPPKVRVRRLAESVGLIRALWAGEPVRHTGEFYRTYGGDAREEGNTIFPRPAEPPKLLIGGNGRELLRLAARQADIIGLTGLGKTLPDGQRHAASGFAAQEVDGRIALLRDAAGARFPQLELNALVQAVLPTEDPPSVAADMATRLPGLSPEQVLETPFVLIGSPSRMADTLRERRERWGITYYSIFGPALDALAPVIPLLR